jgi:hypothetical protein
MNKLFISFEGGPILIGPPSSLESWRGIETADYESLCALFDEDQSLKVIGVPGHASDCIAVDFGGPGTIRAILDGRCLVLVRAWHNDPNSDAVYVEAVSAEEPSGTTSGDIDFAYDTIAIAWAAESLANIPVSVSQPSFPNIDVAVDDSVLLHPLEKGRYRWRRSEISLSSGSVVRLVLDPQ